MDELEQQIRAWVDAEAEGVAPVTADEALGRAGLDEHGHQPAPADARSRRPRALAVLAAAAVLIVGVVAAVVITGGDGPKESIRAGEPGWTTYREPSFDWTLEHPDEWTTQSWASTCNEDVSGSLISNRTEVVDPLSGPTDEVKGEPTCEWDPAQLAGPGFVGVEITHDEGAPKDLGTPEQTERPLFRPELLEHGDRAPAGTREWGDPITIGNDTGYGIRVWIADDASEADIRRLDRVIGSITWADPPPVTEQDPIVPAEGGPQAGTYLTCMIDRGYHPTQELLPSDDERDPATARITWADGEAERRTFEDDHLGCAAKVDAVIDRFQRDFSPWPQEPGASQSPDDASRDQVVPAVAALALQDRAVPLTWFEAGEGTWAITQMPEPAADTGSFDCTIGDPEGIWGEDHICSAEYGEVLLVDDAGIVIRSYPLLTTPSWITATDDAVFAGRIGDGGSPDSTIIRIDRSTLESEVLVFPAEEGILGVSWPNWSVAPDDASIDDLVVGGTQDPDPSRTLVNSRGGITSIDLPAIEELFA